MCCPPYALLTILILPILSVCAYHESTLFINHSICSLSVTTQLSNLYVQYFSLSLYIQQTPKINHLCISIPRISPSILIPLSHFHTSKQAHTKPHEAILSHLSLPSHSTFSYRLQFPLFLICLAQIPSS